MLDIRMLMRTSHTCSYLALHSDVSYLSEPGARSRAGGHFYLKDKTDRESNNGAILSLSKIIKHVMSSASEAETSALFLN